jgi:hypothetical protein
MFSVILIATFSLVISTNVPKFKYKSLSHMDSLPEYDIPKWVYKKVFSHNVIPNYSLYKKRKEEKEIKMFKDILNEEEQLYNLVKEYNLPMGLLQPVQKF